MPSLSFEKALKRGLRADSRDLTIGALSDLRRLVPTEHGLSAFVPVENLLSTATMSAHGITFGTHPFPQLFKGREVTLLASERKVWLVDESDWTLTPLVMYNAENADLVEGEVLANPNFTTRPGFEWEFEQKWHYELDGSMQYTGSGTDDLLRQPAAQMDVELVPGAIYALTYTGTLASGSISFELGTSHAAQTYWTGSRSFTTELVCTSASDALIISVTGNCTLTQVSLAPKNYYDLEDHYVVPAYGGGWHFVDFGPTWMLVNTIGQVFKSGWYNPTRAEDWAYVQTSVKFNTGCAFRGRALYGGFITYFNRPNVDWDTLFEIGQDLGFEQGGQPGSNCVWWSTIGGGDVFNNLLPGIVQNGMTLQSTGQDLENDVNQSLFIEQVRRGESGLMPMDWNGAVLNLQPMRDKVIVYGERAISAVIPYREPLATFGLEERIANVGLASRCAVGGNKDVQMFVDQSGELWVIDGKARPEKLGYKEFLAPMLEDLNYTGHEITVSYNETEQEFWISGRYHSYVKTRTGFYTPQQVVNSIAFPGRPASGFTAVAAGTDFFVTTNPFDMGMSGLKMIEAIEVDYSGITNAFVVLSFRHSKTATWTDLPLVRDGNSGLFFARAIAQEFKVTVRGTYSATAEITNLKVRFQYVDRRGFRDPRGTESGEQTLSSLLSPRSANSE